MSNKAKNNTDSELLKTSTLLHYTTAIVIYVYFLVLCSSCWLIQQQHLKSCWEQRIKEPSGWIEIGRRRARGEVETGSDGKEPPLDTVRNDRQKMLSCLLVVTRNSPFSPLYYYSAQKPKERKKILSRCLFFKRNGHKGERGEKLFRFESIRGCLVRYWWWATGRVL